MICETVYIICFVILVLWMVNRTALMMIIDKKIADSELQNQDVDLL